MPLNSEHPLDRVYKHEYGAGNYQRWWDPGEGMDPHEYHRRLLLEWAEEIEGRKS